MKYNSLPEKINNKFKDFKDTIYLLPGNFFWGDKNYCTTTILGSCISICIWHPVLQIGGICHYIYPGRREKRRKTLNLKYGDDVMWHFMDKIKEYNTRPGDYIVKIFGGAGILNYKEKPSVYKPDQQNIKSGFRRLSDFGFSLDVEHVGGEKSRKLIFFLSNGDVWLKTF